MTENHRSVSSDDPEPPAPPVLASLDDVTPLTTYVEEVPGYGEAAADAGLPEARLEALFGGDDRTLAPDTTAEPWRLTCALRIKAKDGQRFVGTAWLIGPRTLVTAGHCVYMHDHGGWAESIEVIPALDGTRRPFGSFTAASLKSVGGWTEKRNSDFDYGAIVLANDVPNAGAFAIAAVPSSLLRNATVNISGYPSDRDGATRQYFHARQLFRVSDRRLYYHIDTFGGQSGSAAWITVDAAQAQSIGVPVPAGAARVRVAIGIHTAGSFLSNYGTRITEDVVTNLRGWMGGQAQ